MPIDTRFLNNAKDRIGAIKRSGVQFAKQHPRTVTSAAVAALLAPALLQNENRDYTQTAAFTTPLIGSVAYGVSAFGPSVKQNVERMVSMPKAHRQWNQAVHQTEVTYSDIKDVQQAYESQKIALETIQQMKRRRYSGVKRGAPDLHRTATSVQRAIDKNLASNKDLRYISNAIHAENLRSLSAADLVEYGDNPDGAEGWFGPGKGKGKVSGIAPMLNEQQIKAIMDGKVKAFKEGTQSIGDAKFIKGMSARMSELNDFAPSAGRAPVSKFKAGLSIHSIDWKDAEGLRAELKNTRPDLFGAIERASRAGGGNRFDPKYLSIQVSGDSGNAIVGLTYKPAGKRRGLIIPVVSEDGTIRTGKTFQREGVARKVYTADKVYKSDVYAFEAFGLGFTPDKVGEELKRVNMFGMIDESEGWSATSNPAYAEYVQRNGATKLRQHEHVPSHLFGFEGPDRKTMGLQQLRDTVGTGAGDYVDAGVAAAEFHDLIPLGSEGKVPSFHLFAKDVGNLSRNPSLEKQESIYRAVTKNVRMKLPEDAAPSEFFSTGKVFREGIEDPFLDMHIAGITPGEQHLFGGMPDVTKHAESLITERIAAAGKMNKKRRQFIRTYSYEEAFKAAGGYDATAMSIISAEHKLDPAASKAAWSKMVEYLSQPGNLKAMKSAGWAGEGDFIAPKNFRGARVERYMHYDVTDADALDWESFKGTSLERHNGVLDEFGKRTFTLDANGKKVYKPKKFRLGYRNGTAVAPQGVENFIENAHDMGDGITRFTVREVMDAGTGTKLNVLSQKGIMQAFDRTGDDRRLRGGLNAYREATGAGGFIPSEVELFASQASFTNKSSQLQDDFARIAGDTLRRIKDPDDLDRVMSTWKGPLKDAGFDYMEDLGILNQDLFSTSNRTKEQIQTEDRVLKSMLNDVSERMRKHTIKNDDFMESWVSYADKGGELGWADYTHRYAMPAEVRITDHMALNVPKTTKFAYYTQQQLARRGQHGILAEISGRLKHDGDKVQTRELLDHITGKKKITNTIRLDDAMRPGQQSINSAADRAGTVFDPGHVAADKNYLMVFEDGTSVPVPGHSAYGGKVNRYGAGGFSASDSEKALFKLMQAKANKAESWVTKSLEEQYVDSLKKFVHGKESFYRTPGADPVARTLAFHTRPSSMRYADGSINPWEIGIGKSQVMKIRDKEVRDAILSGKPTYAALTREPVSHMPAFRVVLDPHLKDAAGLGGDQRVVKILEMDADGDRPNLHFLKTEEGIADAKEAVENPNSIQNIDVEEMQDKLGEFGDETRRTIGREEGAYKPITSQMKDQKFYTRAEALRKRSAGGGVGSASNTYEMLVAALDENRNVTSSQVKSRMSNYFFQTVKQAPISGMKLKTANGLDLPKALQIDAGLRASMREGGTFDNFMNAMGQLADAKDGGKGTKYRDFLTEHRSVLEDFHGGFDRAKINQAFHVMTTPADKAAKAKMLGMDSGMYAAAQGASTTAEEARTASNFSAEVLGSMNQAKSAAQNVAREARSSKVGIVVAAGIAAAAIAGVMTTHLDRPTATFGRTSSSKYRPEDNAPQTNHVPGQGESGSRAPSRPARSVQPAPSGTSTAVVAPLGETRNLDVQLRARDQQRAHATAKMMARMTTDGDSNVTVNYRSQMNPKSLRTKERMRDALDA